MTFLERRDKRRAAKIIRDLPIAYGVPDFDWLKVAIAAALKRERGETGFAAIGYLFTKSKQAAALRAFEAKHGKVRKR